MTTETVLRDQSIASYALVRSVYKVASEYPSGRGLWNLPPFPTFEQLFEEFIMTLTEKRFTSKEEIDKEIGWLEENDVIDVEYGFRDTQLGVNLKAEFLDTLTSMQCVFVLDGEVINSPLKEVW